MYEMMELIHMQSGKRLLRKKNIWPYLFSAPFLLTFFTFSVYPILFSFHLSSFNWNGISPVKTYVGLKNYIRLFTSDTLFLKALGNSALFVFIIVPLQMIIGVLMAYALYRLKKGQRLFQTVNFLPYITTPVAIGVIFSYIFDWNSGILNGILTRIGLMEQNYAWLHEVWSARLVVILMCIWRCAGYYMTIYLSAMLAVPADLCEAAEIDGADSRTIFFRIILPCVRNTTVFLMITGLIGCFQLFDEPVQLYNGWSVGVSNIGGPSYSVYTVIWKFYTDAYKSNNAIGYASAEAMIFFFIIAILSLVSFFASNRKGDDEG